MPHRLVQLRDRHRLASLLGHDPELNLYALGDLDDFFWPRTKWYSLHPYEGLPPVVLQYAAEPCPTVIALDREPHRMRVLLALLSEALPARFHAHVSPGVADTLAATHDLQHEGRYARMILRATPPACATELPLRRLNQADLPQLLQLYEVSYPGNWFDARMLATGMYFGILDGARVVAVAGIHVYAPVQGVAALGNITTHPDYRGKGYGRAATAALCRALHKDVALIGLNVEQTNTAARCMYAGLGFEDTAVFDEFTVTPHSPGGLHED